MMTLIFATLLLFQPQKTVVHFFYTPDCGHCMDILLGEIPELQSSYSFTFKKYDINSINNYKLLEKMEEHVAEIGEDLPVIFVGDSVFYGPEETRKKLGSTLKILSENGAVHHPDTTSPPPDTIRKEIGEIHLYYFFQPACKECSRIEILLTNLQNQHEKLEIHKYNIIEDSAKIFFEALAEKNSIPQNQRLIVPTIIIGNDHLIKKGINLKQIDALFIKYKKGSPRFDTLNVPSAEKNIIERFSRFSIFGIIIAGLLDGVNPCAFATLIFFVSYLLFIGRRRKDIILMAISFICAVFITYFAIGIGAFNILKYLSDFDIIAKILFLGFGISAIILGILSFRDYIMAKRGNLDKMILQLPLGIKQRIHRNIKEKTASGGIIFGSFVAGLLVSFLEFGCTGQVYLPTITFMISKAGFALKPLFSLFIYNVMFILPLVIIALFATLFSTKKIARSLETKIPTIKFFTALLFFALGILLILSA